MKPLRDTCHVCGKSIRLTRWLHRMRVHGPRNSRCAGSGLRAGSERIKELLRRFKAEADISAAAAQPAKEPNDE